MLEIEDLVCRWNMEQPEPAVELGPAGSKEKLAWSSGGMSSQSRNGASQKGAEQVATWLKESQSFRIPIYPNQPHSPVI